MFHVNGLEFAKSRRSGLAASSLLSPLLRVLLLLVPIALAREQAEAEEGRNLLVLLLAPIAEQPREP